VKATTAMVQFEFDSEKGWETVQEGHDYQVLIIAVSTHSDQIAINELLPVCQKRSSYSGLRLAIGYISQFGMSLIFLSLHEKSSNAFLDYFRLVSVQNFPSYP
jgi:hypothetical protein